MADNFKLPGSSYDELIKILKAYASGKEGQAQTLDAIAQATGMDKTIISRNNGFLVQMEILTEGNKKTPTEDCFALGRAYELGIVEEIQRIWKKLIDNNEFLTRMISAIRIRNGMDRSALCNHILYSAGSTTQAAKVGANTIIEIFKAVGIVEENDGKIVAVENTAISQDKSAENYNNENEKTTIIPIKKVVNANTGVENIINININIEASVGEMDELSEKIKLLLKSINEE